MPLTQQQLETHLWKAADILRGRIDAADYKHYIFGLLFFKRLSDVWREEYEERLARYDGDRALAADPDEHRFHIPAGHFWEDVRQRTTDIGAAMPNLDGAGVGMGVSSTWRWASTSAEQLLDEGRS